MCLQRVGDGVNPAVTACHNGPQRAWRITVYHDEGHASVAGDMFVSCEVHGASVKQGGTAGCDISDSSLTVENVEDGSFVLCSALR